MESSASQTAFGMSNWPAPLEKLDVALNLIERCRTMNESRDEMIKRVRLEIDEAFADVPMPDASNIVVNAADSPYYVQTLAEALANRPRNTVDEDFLKGWYFPFHYLTPEAYHYYFPSILPYGLEPDYVDLCATGRDATHEYQTSLFNEEQYKIACSFVELWFEESPFKMASSLFWRWNRYEHPPLERARAFYQRMRNFEYPAFAEPEINALIHQIRTAFDTAPYPDDEICTHLYDPEAAQSAVEFRGANWRTLHPDFLAREEGALCFFTDKAFRRFLPAYLIANLMLGEMEDCWTNVNPVFHLTYGLVPDGKPVEEHEGFERAVRRFSYFNQQERDAIIAYLRYINEQWDLQKREIDIALERYWLQPLS